MKFLSTTAFDKHLKEAFPDHLAPVFIMAVPDDYERRKYLDKVSYLLRKKDSAIRMVHFNGLDTSLEQVREEILTPSLWGGLTAIILEAADKMKNISSLGDLFSRFPPSVYLLIGVSGFKPLAEIYQKGKKEVIVLDLTDEKPWDKERRLQGWMAEYVRQQEKTLGSDVIRYLFQHLGADLATLDQELAKLVCYVGDKPRIELSDAQAICGSRDLFTGWQLAEKIVWEQAMALGNKPSDLSFVFPFIGQLRYHLQLGCRLAELLENQASPADIQRHFPSLRSAQLDKFISAVKIRRSLFFRRGLQALYDLELASKSTPVDAAILFDIFQAKLYAKALPSS